MCVLVVLRCMLCVSGAEMHAGVVLITMSSLRQFSLDCSNQNVRASLPQ